MFERIRKSSVGVECNSRAALTYLFNCFRYMGLILPQKGIKVYLVFGVLLNIHCVIVTPLAFNLGYLLNLRNLTLDQILNSMQATFDVNGIPLKIITIAIFMRRVCSANELLDELDARCKRPDEQDDLRGINAAGNRIAFMYHLIYHAYASGTFIAAISVGQVPFSLYNPFFDWRDSHSNFCLQILYEAFCSHFPLVHQATNDCYPVIYIYLVRAHIKILAKRLRRMGTVPEMSKEQNYEELLQCIKDHKNILRLLDTVRPAISITLFVQFVCMVLVICTTMVNFVLFADISSRISCTLFAITIFMQTSPCCYQASYLMEDSVDIPLAIFQSNWVDQDPKYRKTLMFFQHAAQQPMKLTALKIFTINLNTNLNIAKFAFSIYTLIKGMDLGQLK